MIIMKANATAEWTVSSAASERAGFTIGNTYAHTSDTRNEESPSLALYGIAESTQHTALASDLASAAPTPAVGAVQRWFARRRGFASGLAVSGIGVGTLVISHRGRDRLRAIPEHP